jgi:peptidoglycan/LPS O-acetylase OafA/YrhL
MTSAPVRDRNTSLDILRFSAALLVLLEHTRAAIFIPYEDVEQHRLLLAPFYALTSMGHEAVMIFFALSGYLVGGQVITQMREGRWSVMDYTLRRMTRLWIVLIPALGLTFLVDQLSISMGNGALYDGTYLGQIVPSLPTSAEPASYSLTTLLGNVFFLQTVVVPVYGSNGPLWSLAYEFWYYVLFPPLAWAILCRGSMSAWILSLAAAIAIALWLPWEMVRLGFVWLAGVAAFIVQMMWSDSREGLPSRFGWVGFIVIAAVALASVVTAGVHDLLLGLAVASSLPLLAMQAWNSQRLRKTAELGAEISYSLYLFHFPVVLALASIVALPDRLNPSTATFELFLGIFASVFLASAALWALFERNTRRVYRASCDLLLRRLAQ